jgi:hypothetical protein
MDIKKASFRYIYQSQSVGDSKAFPKLQVKVAGNPWDIDWSRRSLDTNSQLEFSAYLAQHLRPEAVTVLNTSAPLTIAPFLNRLKELRDGSANLHRVHCPPRHLRKLEYIAALEYGFNPRTASEGRLHAHVLLYNLNAMQLEDIGALWRRLNRIRNPEEPLIYRYTPGTEGIQYSIKAYGSDVDSIYISPKLSLHMGAK